MSKDETYYRKGTPRITTIQQHAVKETKLQEGFAIDAAEVNDLADTTQSSLLSREATLLKP